MTNKQEIKEKNNEFNNSAEFKLHVQEIEFEQKNVYESCCFRVDRRMLEYLSKIIIILTVVLFCMIKLTQIDPTSSQAQIYVTMLWSMVTLIIPAPVLSNPSTSVKELKTNSRRNSAD